MYKFEFSGISEFGGAVVKGFSQKGEDYIDQTHQFLTAFKTMSEENLLKQEIKGEEARMLAQLCSSRTEMEVSDAMALLRLLPMMAKQSRTTTHGLACFAGKTVRRAHDTAKDDADKAAYAAILRQTGRLCFRSKMRPGTNKTQQQQECALFGPFIQDTEEYKSFQTRQCERAKGFAVAKNAKEAADAMCVGSRRRYARFLNDEMGYARA